MTAGEHLPVERRTEPLRGVKAVEVRGGLTAPAVHPIGRYWRQPVDHRQEAVARCRRRPDHRAPELDCSCGFHACPDAETLARVTVVHPDVALADVDLAGRVVEHDLGWRAARQRLLGLRFSDRCARCLSPAARLAAGELWQPLCEPCALQAVTRGVPVLRVAEATATLGIDVRLGPVPVESRRAWRPWRVAAAVAFALALVCLVLLVVLGGGSLVADTVGALGVAVSAVALATLWRLPSSREASKWFSVLCWSVTGLSAVVVLAVAGVV